MKKILCFGDSNTYGFNPKTGGRYPSNIRWTGILSKLCAEKYTIIEAGCNNRTAFSNNPAGDEYTGYKAIKKYISEPIDIVIISLGTNDLQKQYQNTLEDIQCGVSDLIKNIKSIWSSANIYIILPTPINSNILHSYFANLFDENSIKKSKYIEEIYKNIANENGCKLININNMVNPSNIDGLHFDEESHKLIAEEIYKTIKK